MKTSTMLRVGIIGSSVSALCCLSPLLTILFGSALLASWGGHLDAVLMPALIFFMGLTIYAFSRKDRGI